MPHRNPTTTVDVIIHVAGRGVVLVKRRNAPHGWALPGGFIDYGETAAQAAVREALEETGLRVELISLFGVYSDPARDPRQHTMTTVFIAVAGNPDELAAGDDAAGVQVFAIGKWPEPVVFDHGRILDDYARALKRLAS